MAPPRLSQELTQLIIDQLISGEKERNDRSVPEAQSLSSYAAVNKEWRNRIERYTFAVIHLTLARLDDFAHIFSDSRRQSLLRHLDLDIVFDPYGPELWGAYETELEQQRNNEVFTQTLVKLFGILKPWSGDLDLRLSVQLYSHGDIDHMCPADRTKRLKARRKYGAGKDLKYLRYRHSYARLLVQVDAESCKEHQLPEVSHIKHLLIPFCQRRIWPASCTAIMASLPRLQKVEANLHDNEQSILELRKNARSHFAQSIPLWPRSIRNLALDYYNECPLDQFYQPPKIIDENALDLFSANLRDFSQQLTTLDISHIVISPDIFWPSPSANAFPTPSWPFLTHLTIEFVPVTLTGNWILARDPDLSDSEIGIDHNVAFLANSDTEEDAQYPVHPRDKRSSYCFRTKPIPDRFNALYGAAAHAVAHMPALKLMVLEADIPGGSALEFRYVVTPTRAVAAWFGTGLYKGRTIQHNDELVRGTDLFEPSDDVRQKWIDSTKSVTGLDLEILMLPYGDRRLHGLR